MQLLVSREDNRVATNYVTASTSLGFGLGAAVTSLFLFHTTSMSPPSLWIYMAAATLALMAVSTLGDTPPSANKRSLLRLPSFPRGTFAFGLAILLAWATVGLVIAILPSACSATVYLSGADSPRLVFAVAVCCFSLGQES